MTLYEQYKENLKTLEAPGDKELKFLIFIVQQSYLNSIDCMIARFNFRIKELRTTDPWFSEKNDIIMHALDSEKRKLQKQRNLIDHD